MTITRIEAEQMALTGYLVEDTTATASFASGGKLIRIPDTGNTGTATHTFSLDSGTYDITVAYHDESDGVSPFTLNRRQAGQSWQEVSKWSANQNFSNTRASAQNRVLRTISGVSLNKGDEVQIIGQLNVGEVARVDYIEYKLVSSSSPTDTTAPTATGTANDLTLTSGSQNDYTFTVTYSDNQGIKVSSLDSQDLQVTGPNNFSQLATFVSVDTNSDGTPRTATYRISAPGGSWDTNEAGTYTVAVQDSQVNDTSNNAVAAGNLDTFEVTVNPPDDTTAPTATGTADDFSITSGSQNDYTFTVTYSDNQGIKVSSLDSQDLQVTGPNNFSQLATFVSVDTNSDGTPRTATYRISAPGGSWDTNESGTYTVAVQDSQVNDTSNNSVAAVNLDTFQVNVQSAPTTPTETVRVEAEALTLGGGYRTESGTFASGGQLIGLSSLLGNTGTATTKFTGASGQYQVIVGYFDETDGACEISLDIGGTNIDKWVANQSLGDTRASAKNFVKRTVKENVTLAKDAEIKLTGTIHTGENARIDYIEFVPVSGTPTPTDTTAPTATGTANDLTLTSGSSDSYTFTVTYSDNQGIKVSSLDSQDLQVTGPNNFSQLATFVSVDTNSDGTPRTATYRISAPGGSWDTNETGTYTVAVQGSQVNDTSNNAVAAGNLDTFEVTVNPPDDTTPPQTENTADYSNASKAIHANLEQKVGYIPDSNGTLRIMPMGDSITQGKIDNNQAEADREGYRRMLWEKLNSLGVPIDFVGSQFNGTSGFDRDHQGHPGWRINEIKDGRWNSSTSSMSGGVDSWINSQTKPDVVLLMIGTNDADSSGSTMANQLSSLVDKITANNNFTGDLLVSTIAPIHPNSSYYSSRMPNVKDYNSRIPGVVSSKPASENVRFVNMWEGANALLESDITAPPADNGLHPTKGGYEKMANNWFNSVLEATGTKEDLSHHSNIKGSAYNDVIVGNSSNNTLEGGAGNDKITGGSGADKFVYNDPSHGADTLTDFNPSQGDVFEISASGFAAGLVAGTALSTTASNTGVFVNSSSFNYLGSMAHFFYNSLTGVLSFDRDGNQSQAPVTLATLSTKPALSVDQFVIV